MKLHKTEHCIESDHPCLAGHFPGNPIVPGALLLAFVHEQITSITVLNTEASCWRNVKFISPIKPNQPFTITIIKNADSLDFKIESLDRTVIAKGRYQSG